jgi:hypothetical protein
MDEQATTPERRKIADLSFEIAMAEDAAQDAEDRGHRARAGTIRAQIKAMTAELASLQAAR